MYKKIIKKGENEYTYYYTNVRRDEKIQNSIASTKSFVLYILTSDCFLNDFSSDQIITLNANATAKYASSFECGDISLAFNLINEEISSEGMIWILSLSRFSISFNSKTETFPLSAISDLLFSNSSKRNSGANKFILSENSIFKTLPFPINALNKILASKTNCIYEDSINFFDTSKLILSDSSFMSFSDNSNLDENFFNIDNLVSLSLNACLATSDQLISECLSNDFFSSIGRDNVMFTILNVSLCNYVNYVQVYNSFGVNNV